jgi:hypothetical protein
VNTNTSPHSFIALCLNIFANSIFIVAPIKS